MKQRVVHNIDPIYHEDAKVLILGTIPSVKSREAGYPYAHPQNRFWKVLGTIFGHSVEALEEKKDLLYQNHIALWDCIASCDIKGASDASITNVVPNDIASILEKTNISVIFTTGKKSYELYEKYIEKTTGIKAIVLPSPSPANCQMKMEELIEQYSKIKDYID